MFSLISGLMHYLFKRSEYFILIVGLDNAGKTVGDPRAPPSLVVRDRPLRPCCAQRATVSGAGHSADHMACKVASEARVSRNAEVIRILIPPRRCVCPLYVCYPPPQCLLEKFKTIHNPTYKGLPPEKISSTVGLNGRWRSTLVQCSHCECEGASRARSPSSDLRFFSSLQNRHKQLPHPVSIFVAVCR